MKYFNNQKYCDCQFISLINATIFWNNFKLKPYSKKYMELANKAFCINGGCINLEEAYKYLGVKFKKGKYDLKWIRSHLPVQISIFCHKGCHSVLIVKVKNNKLCLTNYANNRLHWISFKRLLSPSYLKFKKEYIKKNKKFSNKTDKIYKLFCKKYPNPRLINHWLVRQIIIK